MNKVKEQLKAQGYKQKDLAILLNPDKPEKYAAHRLSLLLNGHRQPTIHEVKLIADFLNIKIEELI